MPPAPEEEPPALARAPAPAPEMGLREGRGVGVIGIGLAEESSRSSTGVSDELLDIGAGEDIGVWAGAGAALKDSDLGWGAVCKINVLSSSSPASTFTSDEYS